VKTQRDNNKESGSDKITFVSYRDEEELRTPPAAPLDRNRLELFRRAYDANAAERPPEPERRIKFEVVDDNPQRLKKRTGFNPYDTGVVPKIVPPRR
jgi:hypothetical protein